MTWLSRTGLGLAVVAALAVGRLVADFGEDSSASEATFARTGGVGDRIELRYADVEAVKVEAGAKVENGSTLIGSPGRLLVVSLRITATHAPLARPYFQVRDRKSRTFRPDERASGYWVTAQVGVPMTYQVVVDLPRDALEGAVLTMAENQFDQRRDDEAQIDLGIDAKKAAQVWESSATIEVQPAQMDLP